MADVLYVIGVGLGAIVVLGWVIQLVFGLYHFIRIVILGKD